MPISDWYTTKEAAALLGRAVPTISMHARNHKLGELVGNVRVFSEDDLTNLRAIIDAGPGRKKYAQPAQKRTRSDTNLALDAQIVQMASKGLTFQQIGERLAMSRQNAQRRYQRAKSRETT
jgi:DNA-binding CsgD family transcriptional regulator